MSMALFDGYEARRAELLAWVKKNYLPLLPNPRAQDVAGGLYRERRLVDVGCGTGFWAELLRIVGFDTGGFDREIAFVNRGKRDYPKVELWVGDALDPPPEARAGTYDVVFSRTISQLYEPTLENAERVFANLYRWARPGGTILVTAYSDGSGEERPTLDGEGVVVHHPEDDFLAALSRASVEPLELDAPLTVAGARVGNYFLARAIVPEGRVPVRP